MNRLGFTVFTDEDIKRMLKNVSVCDMNNLKTMKNKKLQELVDFIVDKTKDILGYLRQKVDAIKELKFQYPNEDVVEIEEYLNNLL